MCMLYIFSGHVTLISVFVLCCGGIHADYCNAKVKKNDGYLIREIISGNSR